MGRRIDLDLSVCVGWPYLIIIALSGGKVKVDRGGLLCPPVLPLLLAIDAADGKPGPAIAVIGQIDVP